LLTHDSIGLGEDGPTHQPVRASRVAAARFSQPARVPALRRGRDPVECWQLAPRHRGNAERARADPPETWPQFAQRTPRRPRTAAPPALTRSCRPDGKAEVSLFATGLRGLARRRGAQASWPDAVVAARRGLGSVLRAAALPPPDPVRRAVIGDGPPSKVGRRRPAIRQGWDAIIGFGRRLRRHVVVSGRAARRPKDPVQAFRHHGPRRSPRPR